MPLGSSSAAPVTNPGPSVRSNAVTDRSFFAIWLSNASRRPAIARLTRTGEPFSFHAVLAVGDLNVSPETANDRDSRASFGIQGHLSDGAKQDCTHRLGSN